eukprot:scaffold94059_cov32-Prasinocladus_malaysianus.AAC.1
MSIKQCLMSNKRMSDSRITYHSVACPPGKRAPPVDIAVSGLGGWVSVLGCNRRDEEISIRIFAPRGVEVFVRPPMPVPNPLEAQRKQKKN